MKNISKLRSRVSTILFIIIIIGIVVTLAVIIRKAARVANWKDSEISASILRDFKQAVMTNSVADKLIDIHVSAHHDWTDLEIEGSLSEKEKVSLQAIVKQIAQRNANRQINVKFHP